MRRYKGTFDIFFGTEHRMRKEEMEQFNKENQAGMEVCSRHGEDHQRERRQRRSRNGRPRVGKCQMRTARFYSIF